jgi:hypothetical protein
MPDGQLNNITEFREMQKFIAIALLLAAAGCSPTMPPARYDHGFPGGVDVQRLPRAQANAICRASVISYSGSVAGCSWSAGGRCHIVINTDAWFDQEAVLRHEIAHCNGWSGAHER